MKVIDTHTHLPGTLLGGVPRPAEELRKDFEEQGLSGAWIMTLDGLVGDPRPHNDILSQAVRPHREFFVPFCTVWPHLGLKACLDELERAALKLGMRGLKLHPWLQAFSMTHPAVVPILRKAGELGMPVLLHDGTPPYCTPLQVAMAAEQAPQTTIILGHAGLDDLYWDAILACLRLPNVYLCLCSLSVGPISQVLTHCPSDKLLFGSDSGWQPGLVRSALEKFVDLGLSHEEQQRVFHANAERLLPLESSEYGTLS
ncbi:MAG TPA: amidohydrolase family protein [Planctomycetota bacterium]|nr:amidohydrolase family protein [Planctomycetota bacterium]